uniref:GT23 domain-containing protein n=1 Tax=Meloidogyne floridensis TaxID=298350 RepID=A0A915P147_9BILA
MAMLAPLSPCPVVGIHVRRTDKYREAKLQKLEDYLKLVDIWFDVNERNYQNNHSISSNNCTNKRMLFVASDTPVLKDVVKETCLMTYELMHALQGDANEKLHSLDYLYSQFYLQNEKDSSMEVTMEATTEYKPKHDNPTELWAEKGDIIVVSGPVNQDGIVQATNLRLKTRGKFPIYFLKKHTKFENFPAFANINTR